MANPLNDIRESAINLISEETLIEGQVTFDSVARVHGTLRGRVQGRDGSTIILGETAVVEGDISADTLMIDGYVRGDIEARTRVVVSRTGRVLGNIRTPSLKLEFGSYFEGKCQMEDTGGLPPRVNPISHIPPAPLAT